MKLKKFDQYIKEDYSNMYDIEKPVMGDGDDLSTPEDESDMSKMELEIISDEPLEIEHSEEGDLDIKMELSKLNKVILAKIAMGEIDAATICQEIMDSCEEYGDKDMEHEESETEDFEDMEDELGLGEEEHEPMMSLGEMLNFKNFNKRK